MNLTKLLLRKMMWPITSSIKCLFLIVIERVMFLTDSLCNESNYGLVLCEETLAKLKVIDFRLEGRLAISEALWI